MASATLARALLSLALLLALTKTMADEPFVVSEPLSQLDFLFTFFFSLTSVKRNFRAPSSALRNAYDPRGIHGGHPEP